MHSTKSERLAHADKLVANYHAFAYLSHKRTAQAHLIYGAIAGLAIAAIPLAFLLPAIPAFFGL